MSVLGTRKRRITAVVAAVGIVAAGGSLAFAYWTDTGTGVGTATTGFSENFVVTSTAPEGEPLTPGGPTQTVAFNVANTGTGSQNLTSVVVTAALANGDDWTATEGCAAADYTIGTPEILYGELAGGADVDGSVTITMNNLNTNQDGCKGAVVPLYFVAS